MRPRDERGSTILETMIGLGMVLIATLASSPLILRGSRMADAVALDQKMRMAARDKLDEIRAADFETLVAVYDGQVFEQTKLTAEATPDQTTENPDRRGRVAIQPITQGPLAGQAVRIHIRMEWKGGGQAMEYILSTFQARP